MTTSSQQNQHTTTEPPAQSATFPTGLTAEQMGPPKAPPAAKVILGVTVVAFLVFFGVKLSSAAEQRNKAQAESAQKSNTAPTSKAKTAATHETIKGESISWTPRVRLEGILQPAREVDLSFKTGGQLERVGVKLGSYVKTGEVLGELVDSEAKHQKDAAAAQIEVLDVQRRIAADNSERTGKLAKSGVTTEVSATQAELQLALVDAQRKAAQAQLSLAQTNVQNHILRAPFAGIITRAPTAIGSIVGPGAPMFHIADLNSLKLVGSVNETEARHLKPGALIKITTDQGVLEGKVTVVLPTLDPMTRRVPIEAEIDGKDIRSINTGALVKAMAEGREPIAALRYPADVIFPGTGDQVEVATSTGTRRQRIVYQQDSEKDGFIVVSFGVSADDVLIRHRGLNDAENPQATIKAAAPEEAK